jgi:hypothetical protein
MAVVLIKRLSFNTSLTKSNLRNLKRIISLRNQAKTKEIKAIKKKTIEIKIRTTTIKLTSIIEDEVVFEVVAVVMEADFMEDVSMVDDSITIVIVMYHSILM